MNIKCQHYKGTGCARREGWKVFSFFECSVSSGNHCYKSSKGRNMSPSLLQKMKQKGTGEAVTYTVETEV